MFSFRIFPFLRCMVRKADLLPALMFILMPAFSIGAYAEEGGPADPAPAADEKFKRFEMVFEPDAYYTNLAFILSLTRAPIPHVGEKSEHEIYSTLLSRAALLPRYILLEGSINPLPYLGSYIKRNEPGFYEDARISGSFNWVKALTAGFEEPYALSLFAGNVVGFDIPGKSEITGNGYSGYLYSVGKYHIKDNVLINDRWQEAEWKVKGDRKSPNQKLSWSFRIGGKFHENPDITDIFYLSFRRSRLDYKVQESSLLNNSGFEYTYDLDRKNLRKPMRHYFYVDKKWPLENRRMAVTLAAGFVWESANKYAGELATVTGSSFQFIIRPNVEF